MKKFMFLFAFILFSGVGTGHAQVKKTGPDAGPLVGMWQYVEEVTTAEGGKAYIGKQIFKTITEDNTYFVILGVNIPIKEANWEESKTSTLAFISQEGEIEMKEENTYLEYINKHYLDKSLNNTISNLRFEFNEKNPNILYIEYNLGDNNDDNWVKEVWLRVMPYGL